MQMCSDKHNKGIGNETFLEYFSEIFWQDWEKSRGVFDGHVMDGWRTVQTSHSQIHSFR